MASDVTFENRNGSNKALINKQCYPKAQRAGLYSDNINPLAVLISLPLASLHRSMKTKRRRAASLR